MSSLGKTIFVIVLLSVPVTMFIGCSEDQLHWLDSRAADVNSVTVQGQRIVESPAGDLIPEPIRTTGSIVLNVAQAAALAWLAKRKSTERKIAKSIVDAIEQTDEQTQTAVKEKVAETMQANKVADTGRVLVRQLKA